jgi:SAM-dependent methyltransferase
MGRYTLVFADRGLQIEGLDLSPVLLDRLRAYARGRFDVPLHCAVVEHPPDGLEGRFDVVVGLFVLHHVEDLTSALAAMARLLRPGGRAVFLEPNPYNPIFYVQMLITPGMTWAGDGGLIRMRRSVVFDAFRRAGFVRPRMQRFGFFPPFLANHRVGAGVESLLERVALWRGLLPFQLFGAQRP